MQRLGELNNKVIVEQKYAPENKHVIWKDPGEDKFKEYKDGQWTESDQIAPAGGDDFPYKYFIIEDEQITYTVKGDEENNDVIGHLDINIPVEIFGLIVKNISGNPESMSVSNTSGPFMICPYGNGDNSEALYLNINGDITIKTGTTFTPNTKLSSEYRLYFYR